MLVKPKRTYSASDINFFIAKYKESGLSIEAFTKQAKISRSAFYRWITNRKKDSAFVPAIIENKPNLITIKKHQASEPIKLNLGNDLSLTFDSSLSPVWLADFVKELK